MALEIGLDLTYQALFGLESRALHQFELEKLLLLSRIKTLRNELKALTDSQSAKSQVLALFVDSMNLMLDGSEITNDEILIDRWDWGLNTLKTNFRNLEYYHERLLSLVNSHQNARWEHSWIQMYYDGIRTSQRSIQFHFLEAGNDPAVRQILRETRNRLVLEIDNLKTEVEHGESKLLSLIERVDQLDAILTEQANDLEDIHRKITYLKTQVSNILTRIAEIVDLYHRQ